MKCPNCGEELKQGYLYCEKCGGEIHIVPDFEPEIENSIIETLSAVAEELSPETPAPIGKEEEDFVIESSKKVGKRVFIALLFFAFFVALVFRFGFSKEVMTQDTRLEQLIAEAREEYNQKNYKQAASTYEKILKSERKAEYLIYYADCLYELQEVDQALSNYYAAIEIEPDNTMAYARIIAMFEADEDYEEINRLLIASNNETIQTEFQNYMVLDPVFSYSGGIYKKVIPLKITAATTGEVYYTLDGTDPMKYGTLYTSPVFLKSGSYHVKAVYINNYGICSNVSEEKYEIEGTRPEAPQIALQSGQYTTPQMITVTVPQDCTVYYTTDSSSPDENSFIYGEPIPMKEGVTNYHFIAISNEGVYSDVVARSYQLTIETVLKAEDSVDRLKRRLIEINLIEDMDGSLSYMSGKNIYVYNSVQIIEDKIMHVIFEYYQEGDNYRNMTGKIYCIDVSNAFVYKFVKDENGNEILEPV